MKSCATLFQYSSVLRLSRPQLRRASTSLGKASKAKVHTDRRQKPTAPKPLAPRPRKRSSLSRTVVRKKEGPLSSSELLALPCRLDKSLTEPVAAASPVEQVDPFAARSEDEYAIPFLECPWGESRLADHPDPDSNLGSSPGSSKLDRHLSKATADPMLGKCKSKPKSAPPAASQNKGESGTQGAPKGGPFLSQESPQKCSPVFLDSLLATGGGQCSRQDSDGRESPQDKQSLEAALASASIQTLCDHLPGIAAQVLSPVPLYLRHSQQQIVAVLRARAAKSLYLTERIRQLCDALGGAAYPLAKSMVPARPFHADAEIESQLAFYRRLATQQVGHKWRSPPVPSTPSFELRDQLMHPFLQGLIIRRLQVLKIFNSKTKPLLIVMKSQHWKMDDAQEDAEAAGAEAAGAEAAGAEAALSDCSGISNDILGEQTLMNLGFYGKEQNEKMFTASSPTSVYKKQTKLPPALPPKLSSSAAARVGVVRPLAGSKKDRSAANRKGHAENGQKVAAAQRQQKPSRKDKHLQFFAKKKSKQQQAQNTQQEYVITRLILKVGDDIRLDQACMGLFRVFNHMWRRAGLQWKGHNGNTHVYHVVAMASDLGVIECVKDCVTIKDVAQLGLKETAKDRIVASAACAYIAGYVVGLADRHFDNILVTKHGTLFHIDFGFLMDDGPAVDTHPFAVTKSLLQVIGHDRWLALISFAVKAYSVLRQEAEVIINFAALLLEPLGISREKVTRNLTHTLQLGVHEKTAHRHLIDLLVAAPESLRTKAKNLLHSTANAISSTRSKLNSNSK